MHEGDERKTLRSLGEEYRLERDVDPALVFDGTRRTFRCVFVFSGDASTQLPFLSVLCSSSAPLSDRLAAPNLPQIAPPSHPLT